jgi:hypothetical protein
MLDLIQINEMKTVLVLNPVLNFVSRCMTKGIKMDMFVNKGMEFFDHASIMEAKNWYGLTMRVNSDTTNDYANAKMTVITWRILRKQYGAELRTVKSFRLSLFLNRSLFPRVVTKLQSVLLPKWTKWREKWTVSCNSFPTS